MKKKSSAGISGIIKSAVTDTVQASASFQSASGITAKVIRTAHAGCCETCAALAGEYVYGEQPADFFRRHNGCSCTVAYDPGSGRYENVHKSQAWNESQEAIEWRKQFSAEIERKENERLQERLRNAKVKFKTGGMKPEEYAEYKSELRAVKNYNQIYLEKDEYAMVISRLNTDLSQEDRKHAIITKAIGDYYYTIINRGFNDYTIIKKEMIF